MKILALLVLAVAVSARPEYGTQRLAESQELRDSLSAQDSASLPSREVQPMLIYLPEYGIAGARRPLVHRTKLPERQYQRHPLQPQAINAQTLGVQQLTPQGLNIQQLNHQALGFQQISPQVMGLQQLSPQALGIHRIYPQGLNNQQGVRPQPALRPQTTRPMYSQALPLLLPLPIPQSIPYDLDISDWLSGLEESIRAEEDSVLVAASDSRRTSLLLKPVAKAVAGPRGVAVASPIAKAILRKGEPVTIDFDPDAVAIAGPGGSAEAHPKLVISYASENQDLASLTSTPASDIQSSTPRPHDQPEQAAHPIKETDHFNAPDKVISMANYRQ